MLELYDHADELTFDADEEAWKKMIVEMNGRLEGLKGSATPKTTQKTIQKKDSTEKTTEETIQKDNESTQKAIQNLSDQQKAIMEYLIMQHPDGQLEISFHFD